MPWRGRNGTHCRSCGKPVAECGPLSARYKCKRCGHGAMIANVWQLHNQAGPRYEHWLHATIAGLSRAAAARADTQAGE